MASIYWQSDNTPVVQFTGPDKRRRKMRLAFIARNLRTKELTRNSTTERDVQRYVDKLEGLIKAVRSGNPLDDEVELWLTKLPAAERKKLESFGLIRKTVAELAAEAEAARLAEERAVADAEQQRLAAIPRLGQFLEAYVAGRTDLKEQSKTVLNHTKRNLVAHFGADKIMAEVTEGDADDFKIYLKSKEELSIATVNRRCSLASQFFRAAIRKGYCTTNPFLGTGAIVRSNEERKRHISLDDTAKLIDAAPDAEWRLIIALSRYAGLRTPSEHNLLRWENIDWPRGRFKVTSPKTEHHHNGAFRWVPIFPELRPYLEDMQSEAVTPPPMPGPDAKPAERERILREREAAGFVLQKYRNQANLRTRFAKIVKRAKLEKWPKLFHNLRSSCQTDLAKKFPMYLVCAWLGNKAAIAQEHYLQVTDSDFESASKITGAISAHSGGVSDALECSKRKRASDDESSKAPEFAISSVSGETPISDQWAIQDSNL